MVPKIMDVENKSMPVDHGSHSALTPSSSHLMTKQELVPISYYDQMLLRSRIRSE